MTDLVDLKVKKVIDNYSNKFPWEVYDTGISNMRIMPYIIVSGSSSAWFTIFEIKEWLEDNIPDGEWFIYNRSIRLATENQAMLFKLTWQGANLNEFN